MFSQETAGILKSVMFSALTLMEHHGAEKQERSQEVLHPCSRRTGAAERSRRQRWSVRLGVCLFHCDPTHGAQLTAALCPHGPQRASVSANLLSNNHSASESLRLLLCSLFTLLLIFLYLFLRHHLELHVFYITVCLLYFFSLSIFSQF